MGREVGMLVLARDRVMNCSSQRYLYIHCLSAFFSQSLSLLFCLFVFLDINLSDCVRASLSLSWMCAQCQTVVHTDMGGLKGDVFCVNLALTSPYCSSCVYVCVRVCVCVYVCVSVCV